MLKIPTPIKAGTLKTSAIISNQGASAVLLVDPVTLVARLQPIKLGPPVGDLVSVTAGLSPGDLVIVAGSNQVADGSTVRLLDTQQPN